MHVTFAVLFSIIVIFHTRLFKQSKGNDFQTEYIKISPHHCKACWKCMENCPKHVFGKIDLPLHKHIKIINSDACIGCRKCIKSCNYKAISAK